MILFFIGVIEMVIISTWTKAVTETKIMLSGLVTIINVLIWYYVLETVIKDMANIQVIIQYAIGCALGTMLTTAYFAWHASKKTKAAANKI